MSASSTSQQRYDVRVHRVVRETRDVVTLHIEQPRRFRYEAGQYITVFFDDTNVPEGKAYSVSSYPGDLDLSITVKKVGLFSGKLHRLQPGDMLTISPAYGMFNAFGDRPLVALAAGVGIAPIYSIIRQEVLGSTGRQVQLIYSNTTEDAIVFRRDLARFTTYAPHLSVRHIVTRQADSAAYGPRMDGATIAREFPGRAICICGTVTFVRDLRAQLVMAGVKEDDIMTEAFFEAGR